MERLTSLMEPNCLPSVNAQANHHPPHKRLSRLHKLSWQVALGECDLTHVLHEVGWSLRTILKADIVMLYPYNKQQGLLEYPHIFGEIYGKPTLQLPSLKRGIVGKIFQTHQPYYAPCAQKDPLLINLAGTDKMAEFTDSGKRRAFSVRQGIISFAGVPMIANGEIVGVLCLNYRTPHTFPTDEQQLLELVAQFAAIALYNVAINKQAEMLIATRERTRLALSLHHALSQNLPAIRMYIETAELYLQQGLKHSQVWYQVQAQLEQIKQITIQASNDMRSTIQLLTAGDNRQVAISSKSSTMSYAKQAQNYVGQESWSKNWLTQLKEEIKSAKALYNLNFMLAVETTIPQALPQKQVETLCLVCRESITNIGKHAQADYVEITISSQSNQLHLTFQDDGRGFDPSLLTEQPEHGLSILQRHIAYSGGQLNIVSNGIKGATVQLMLPLL